MRVCASVACALLVALAVPASAGERGVAKDLGTLDVLRGALLEAGELGAPFAEAGARLGRFVLRSEHGGDLRVHPGAVRLTVPGGALRARAADAAEDVGGLLELCRLGISPFPCATLPLRPRPGTTDGQGIYYPLPLIALNTELTDQEDALLGCGPFYGTECDGSALLPDWGLRAAGNGRFGRRDFVWQGGGEDGPVYTRNVDVRTGRPHVLVGETFTSEMAVLSWNAIMALVAGTYQEGEPSDDTFDPEDPLRTDGCSFANPGACANVAVVGSVLGEGWRFTELSDDPRGGDAELWLWESAIAYDVVNARGSLAGFLGGRVYVFGPFESDLEGSTSGVGLLLVPPPGAALDPTSPMVRVVPGPDRVLGTWDDLVAGLAWGAARTGFDGVTKSNPKPRGRALGRGGRFKAGAGRSGSPGGRLPGRP